VILISDTRAETTRFLKTEEDEHGLRFVLRCALGKADVKTVKASNAFYRRLEK
jgi:hypothetical protein